MSHDEFKKIDTPDGTHLEHCPVCASPAELWRRSDSPSSPIETAVCCGNGNPIGPQDGIANEGCLLFMPPDNFYRPTMRDAVKYWNEYAKAVSAQQRANRWAAAQVLRGEAAMSASRPDDKGEDPK